MAFSIHLPHRDHAFGATVAAAARSLGAGVVNVPRHVAAWLRDIDRRQAEREIAAQLARSGGRLTDSMEREIMRKAMISDWSLPGNGHR